MAYLNADIKFARVRIVEACMHRVVKFADPAERIALFNSSSEFAKHADYWQHYDLVEPKFTPFAADPSTDNSEDGNEGKDLLVIEFSRLRTSRRLHETLSTMPLNISIQQKLRYFHSYTAYYLGLVLAQCDATSNYYRNLTGLVVYITPPYNNDTGTDYALWQAETSQQRSERIMLWTRAIHGVCMQSQQSLAHFIFIDSSTQPKTALTRELDLIPLLTQLPNLETVFLPNMQQLYEQYRNADDRVDAHDSHYDVDLLQRRCWQPMLWVPEHLRMPKLTRLVLYDSTINDLLVRNVDPWNSWLMDDEPLLVLRANCVVEVSRRFLDLLNADVCAGLPHKFETARKMFRGIADCATDIRKYNWSTDLRIRECTSNDELWDYPQHFNIKNQPPKFYRPFTHEFITERMQKSIAERNQLNLNLANVTGYYLPRYADRSDGRVHEFRVNVAKFSGKPIFLTAGSDFAENNSIYDQLNASCAALASNSYCGCYRSHLIIHDDAKNDDSNIDWQVAADALLCWTTSCMQNLCRVDITIHSSMRLEQCLNVWQSFMAKNKLFSDVSTDFEFIGPTQYRQYMGDLSTSGFKRLYKSCSYDSCYAYVARPVIAAFGSIVQHALHAKKAQNQNFQSKFYSQLRRIEFVWQTDREFADFMTGRNDKNYADSENAEICGSFKQVVDECRQTLHSYWVFGHQQVKFDVKTQKTAVVAIDKLLPKLVFEEMRQVLPKLRQITVMLQ